MDYEDKICEFKKYAKQTQDLMIDSYKWKMMAEDCDDEEMHNKYMQVSNMLYDLYMTEYNNITAMFKNQ